MATIRKRCLGAGAATVVSGWLSVARLCVRMYGTPSSGCSSTVAVRLAGTVKMVAAGAHMTTGKLLLLWVGLRGAGTECFR